MMHRARRTRFLALALALPLMTGCPLRELTVTPPSHGTVVLDPPGGYYQPGEVITVTAVPEEGYAFAGWTGALSGAENPTTIKVRKDTTIGATFTILQFTVTVAETTNGTVALDPPDGIYDYGTVVTVTAAPATQYYLAEWTGDLSGNTNPAPLTVTHDSTVGATYEKGVIITLASADHGTFNVSPAVTSGSAVPWGATFTITATPDQGYTLDSAFKMLYVIEPFWAYYASESFTTPFAVTTDQGDARFKLYGGELNKYVLGAFFIPSDTWAPLTETLNVPYAKPGSKQLQYDVYAPPGATGLPVVVIVHGGGWSTNTEDIMRGQARYLAQTGRYVVASIDYRLTTDLDTPAPTMQQLIGDVFGAIAHIQEHARSYGGDPTRLAVTGDSAGGHLAAVVGLMSNRIGSGPYDGSIGSQFMPTYIPAALTVDDVRASITTGVKAVAPSYGAFTRTGWDPAITPLLNIPLASDRVVPPQYCQVGSKDTVVGAANVKTYVDALVAAGQTALYVEIPGASHAYFDWKPDATTQATFKAIGQPALDQMIAFFDSVFLP